MTTVYPTCLWRLCKAKYAKSALSGEGARLYAGRWNPAGTAMVYTSTSKALACVELFVHLDSSVLPKDFVEVGIAVPDDMYIETMDEVRLPHNWRVVDHPDTQRIGADWVQSGLSAGLRVPSAVIQGEWNVVLNPAHSDFLRLTAREPVPFRFDARIFR